MSQRTFDPIPTRHSLLNRLKDWDDRTSWQDFFDTYWQLIYNVSIKAGLSDVEAQEVVQETVISVARKIGEFKADPAHGSFSAWLMQLTHWRITDQQRKRGKQAQFVSGAGDRRLDETSSTPTIERIQDPVGGVLEHLWQEEWEKHLMAAALERVKQQVSPRQFQMFDLHVLQKQSVNATARTLQSSVASVYMARHRLTRILKKEIQKLEERISSENESVLAES
jgi:RNA polymerase sigma factor (sigma-70 family)